MTETDMQDMKALVVRAVVSWLSAIQMLPEPHRGRAMNEFVEAIVQWLHKGGYQPKSTD